MSFPRRPTLRFRGRGRWIVIPPDREAYEVPAPHPSGWQARAQELIGAELVSGVPLDAATDLFADDVFLDRPDRPNNTARAVAALYGQQRAAAVNGTVLLTGRVRHGQSWLASGLRGPALARARRLVSLAGADARGPRW